MSSATNFPAWRSRFARSSGFHPELGDTVAPPLGPLMQTPPRKPAPDRTIEADASAAGRLAGASSCPLSPGAVGA
jgi:hypothetical protein